MCIEYGVSTLYSVQNRGEESGTCADVQMCRCADVADCWDEMHRVVRDSSHLDNNLPILTLSVYYIIISTLSTDNYSAVTQVTNRVGRNPRDPPHRRVGILRILRSSGR